MDKITRIQLFCSPCARNDFYLERIRQAAEELGLRCALEKVTDEAAIAAMGLDMNCQTAYCPGCRAMHTDPAERYVPALAVDGRLRCWNVPPGDEELRRLLAEAL